jgi:flagellar hook-associated protein 2
MSSLSSLGSTSSALTSATSSSTGSTSSGTLSVGGLISGLNTTQLIQGLLAVQQAQITAVQDKQTAASQRESAYKALEAQLLTFQSSVTQLAQPVNGPFDGHTVTSSDQTILTAAASSSAAAGNYSLTVGTLAQANEIASQNFDSASSKITHGTLTVGSGSTRATITIDGTNDTLQGLASAINGANTGISATVINDGSSHPYRLLLTANNTGLANAITFDASGLAASGNGAVQPTFGVGAAVAGGSNVGTATATAGGVYTGTINDTYTLKVTGVTAGGDLSNGGTVTLAYANGDNSVTGNFTLTAADLNQFHDVAKGVKVKLGPGPLSVNDQFTINTTVATVQNATDASVTLGSGPGAVTVTSASNTINNVIAGVTLNLVGANPSKAVQISVTNDTDTAQKAIQDFVTNYNSVITTIDADVKYDAQTNTAGVLLGDTSIVGIQDQLRNLVTGVVAGANPKLNNLSALGITSDDTGQLQINSSQLNKVLSGQVSGVTLADVRRLFAPAGTSTNPGVTFVNATNATKPSATAYGVDITQAALQATLTADTTPSLSITSGNNTFTLTVNGVTSGTLTIPPGSSYTSTSLVQAIQAQIGADSKIGNLGVSVGIDGNGRLTFTSGTYGSSSSVAIGAAGFLGFNSAASALGQDVAGSFLVNGQSEPATGSGQLLTGKSGNANTAGLAVRVSLLASEVGSGSEANVSVSRGLAAQLSTALDGLLNPVTGRLQSIDQNFQDQISSYQKTIDQLQQEYNTRQDQLTQEFVNLETTLSSLKSVSSFLTAQTSALSSLSGSSSSKSSG